MKYVVYNFGGTLADSMKMIYGVLNYAFWKRGLPTIELDLRRRMAGGTHTVSDILAKTS